MIIKKVLFKKNKSNFKNLANYILDENNSNAKILINYILDEKNEMEKVEAYNFSNCSFNTKEDNIAEILNTQKLNTTTKQDKTMHLVVSFREDENPSIELMKKIEDEIAKALGMQNHQRLSVVHSNTNNLHMHIAINKIDPITCRVKNPYNDVKILQETAIKLERKYNLKKDNHMSNFQKQSKKYDHSYTLSFESWVKEKLDNKLKNIFKKEDLKFDEIVYLLGQHDLEFKERRNGFCISSKSEKLFCKASSINRNLSKQMLEKRFGKINLDTFINIKSNQKSSFNYEPTKKEQIHSNCWNVYRALENEKKHKKQLELKNLEKEIQKIYKNKYTSKSQKREKVKEKRDFIYQKYKYKSYRDFLIDEILEDRGNEEIYLSLRRNKSNLDINENNLFSKNDKPKIFKDFDYITKEGFAVYKNDENKIIDKGNFLKISLQNNNRDFLLKTLEIAIDRFGKELDITGDFNFKKEILEVVNEYNLDVKFTDKNMEKINIINKQSKQDIKAKKYLKKIIEIKSNEILLNKKLKKDIREKSIKSLNRLKNKLENTGVSLFEGDFKMLDFDKKIISQMKTKKVDIKIDGLYVDDKNMSGISAMNEEVRLNFISEGKDKELEKFEKFLYLLQNTNKVKDIAVGFYENRKVDTKTYLEKYDMQISKINKQINAIELGSNFEIIKSYYNSLNVKINTKKTQEVLVLNSI
ncbi:TraI/MobA(P) family conjugative relaxase [Campylobacter ureolyticus]|uniref:TraI/MobA(P) family conjugative relaxase n=1 Tax=Campylobacter ureolyticus TaxID=827 RepID=UPI0022B4AC23|nr:TraI/MobA(P) family conjugative relaxase [Campylobacter ureolyticus]MCZ6174794.1 relaxase/mobilization nuclease domain-containing protein [Campylobacter ureolyticus]